MSHIPVLLKETINALNIKKNGIYIDGTFGNGGHTKEILKYLGQSGKLYSIDQDIKSVNKGKKIKDKRFSIIFGKFSKKIPYIYKKNKKKKIDGILLDLGISSNQINQNDRGFSFMKNGLLDMRMNNTTGIPAWKWLKKSSQKEIEKVLRKYGEERYSKKISYAIYNRNKKKTITQTLDLVQIIKKAIPKIDKYKHPATRTFQAIRIHINNEIKELKKTLKISIKILKKKRRLVIICFHSLENRIVKNFFKKHGKTFFIPRGLPITEKKIKKIENKKIKIIKKIKPKKTEIQKNKRSRSAILRIAEML
ncbi:16S rRNA (cytosine(1402)-N(4))-methyltransferase RsmH [Buchnera aphidicola]|uniref:Ribosomal RNA small subunit methyltransferase H n=1 Tax=Buchnera aphidicola subsp. Cinara cedri (strain Cc) TaxID=372461 RepID=RSMH_BUCCC|nr:16S rRNA (cytosine(1402)-N(4))-methyltransferase RsmH [Buchnera aphidicola]Q057T6.1 RecName: Full=Ribosomal RNA small subunit methyltransferase H; AltName: Full=16S rRNA m(4)C1402 methyltransferase; AltName: Full=rRNA (cytosine-N(4)-)-methyltransferase RsmH [Buchnera aphidicola BCc]ABJ90613.1 S-adenosyl-dependent methyl transferase [Buchnera aphidicola BCc]